MGGPRLNSQSLFSLCHQEGSRQRPDRAMWKTSPTPVCAWNDASCAVRPSSLECGDLWWPRSTSASDGLTGTCGCLPEGLLSGIPGDVGDVLLGMSGCTWSVSVRCMASSRLSISRSKSCRWLSEATMALRAALLDDRLRPMRGTYRLVGLPALVLARRLHTLERRRTTPSTSSSRPGRRTVATAISPRAPCACPERKAW
mmetsp:Transcript_13735/g.40965  ORF Transcript_13735/g.40965 Transcript_13735/m.40965 type:complete len:200 (+) Transcript_13735:787-1386(+)